MNKLNGAAVLLASMFVANATLADAPKESGFYAGAALGNTEFDDDGAFTGLGFDDTDSSLIAFAGYKFLRYFAIEGRYGDLGSYSVSPAITTEKVSIDVASIHAVGLIPFGESGWELYGQLGAGRVEFSCSGCGSENVASAGLGIRYFPNRRLGIGFQFDVYGWEEDPFDFSIGTAQIVLKYMF